MKAGCRELFSKQKSKGLDGNSKEKKKKNKPNMLTGDGLV